jgi:hypothetical protein
MDGIERAKPAAESVSPEEEERLLVVCGKFPKKA